MVGVAEAEREGDGVRLGEGVWDLVAEREMVGEEEVEIVGV